MSKDRKERKSLTMDAVMMRWMLSIALFLILAGTAAGFYVGYQYIDKKNQEVNAVKLEAKKSEQTLANLRLLGEELEKYKPDVEKAKNIVAEAKSYKYQDQVIAEITNFGQIAGIRVQSFTFDNGSAASGGKSASSSSTSTSTSAASSNAAAGQSSGSANSGAASGTTSKLKSTKVILQLGPEVSYRKLLHFINLIEQNITRMQIMGLSMTRSEKGADAVSSQPITLEVYIR